MTKVLLAVSARWQERLASTVLSRDAFERVPLPEGIDVVEAARAVKPRLILLEGTTEETRALLKRLRHDPATRRASLAVIVAAPTEPDEDALRQAGANVVLSGADAPAQWDDPFEQLLAVPPRKDVRVPVAMGVTSRLQKTGTEIRGVSVNVSLKGLLIELAEPVAPGTLLRLSFQLPSSTDELRLMGRVVWTAPAPGGTRCGVRFLGFHGSAMELIRAFVDAAADGPAPS
jgi:hypothetical protein